MSDSSKNNSAYSKIGRGKRLHAAHGDIVADGIDERTAGTVLRRPVRKQARQLNGGLRGARQELGQRIDAAVLADISTSPCALPPLSTSS